MEIRLLGPLEIVAAASPSPIPVGGAKRRGLLALLALHAPAPVSLERIVESLWHEPAPPGARATVQSYVSQLRRTLGVAIPSQSGEYRLAIARHQVDVHRFEHQVAAAISEPYLAKRVASINDALQLWRGDPLGEFVGQGWADDAIRALEQIRLHALERRIDAQLELGRQGDVLAELERLIVEHPFHERFSAQQMLALYRSRRPADALRVAAELRAKLTEELGVDPNPEIVMIERQVLDHDPALWPTGIDSTNALAPLPSRLKVEPTTGVVGREVELALLADAFKRVATGSESEVVLISGDAGIGKTTLVAEAARAAASDGACVLLGRCQEDLTASYAPFVEALDHYVTHSSEATLREHVAVHGGGLARMVPALGRRLGEFPDPTITDPDTERHLLFAAVVGLLAQGSTSQPVVLVLDDLQWADKPTLQLLRHVVANAESAQVLVLATFRDSELVASHPLTEVLGELWRETAVYRIELKGFSEAGVVAFMEAAAGHEIDAEVMDLTLAVYRETEGNPFFVGEVLRNLTDTGAIVLDDEGRWLATRDLAEMALPKGVREVIGARVARLGERASRVLSLAAVIGRDFDFDLLNAVTQLSADDLLDLLDAAAAAALVRELTDVPGRWCFSHVLTQHTLYQDLGATRRARAHRQIAEALEELCGEHTGARVGELAHHWFSATQPTGNAKAIVYARQAAEAAVIALAPDDAVRYFSQALQLIALTANSDPLLDCDLRIGLGEAQRQTGDPAHRETLLNAAHLADRVGAVHLLVRAALANNRGWASTIGAVDHERVEVLTRALTRIGEDDSPDRARLLATLCVERIYDPECDDRLSAATEAVDMARRSGDAAALIDAIRLSYDAITVPDTLEVRWRWTNEACDLVDDLGDPLARLLAHGFRAMAALEHGDLEVARTSVSIVESEAQRLGQPGLRWQALFARAVLWMLEGASDATEQAATDALTVGVDSGQPDAVIVYGIQLMVVRWQQGRLREMVPLIEQAVLDNPRLGVLRTALVWAKSDEDSRAVTTQDLDTAVADNFPTDFDNTWLAACVHWAEVAARVGHRRATTVLYERLLPWRGQFVATGLTVHGAVAHYLGLLAHVLDHYDEADECFAEALALHERMESPFFTALTQTAWAALLADRNQPGDAQQARALLDAALPVATAGGYGYIGRDARAVLERIE